MLMVPPLGHADATDKVASYLLEVALGRYSSEVGFLNGCPWLLASVCQGFCLMSLRKPLQAPLQQ